MVQNVHTNDLSLLIPNNRKFVTLSQACYFYGSCAQGKPTLYALVLEIAEVAKTKTICHDDTHVCYDLLYAVVLENKKKNNRTYVQLGTVVF